MSRDESDVELVVGRIGRAHGIRGEVSVEVRTDEPELRLAPGAELATEPAAAGPLTVAAGRVQGGRLVLAFEGVRDRTAAEALRGTLLLAEVDPEESPEDPEEFYDRQLVGLAACRPDGAALGTVAEVLHLPYQDLLVVRAERGGEVLVPFVAEIVPVVDPPAGRVVIDPPVGLFADQAEER